MYLKFNIPTSAQQINGCATKDISFIIPKIESLQVQRKNTKDNRSYTFEFELFLDCQKSDYQLGSVMYLINIFTGSPC